MVEVGPIAAGTGVVKDLITLMFPDQDRCRVAGVLSTTVQPRLSYVTAVSEITVAFALLRTRVWEFRKTTPLLVPSSADFVGIFNEHGESIRPGEDSGIVVTQVGLDGRPRALSLVNDRLVTQNAIIGNSVRLYVKLETTIARVPTLEDYGPSVRRDEPDSAEEVRAIYPNLPTTTRGILYEAPEVLGATEYRVAYKNPKQESELSASLIVATYEEFRGNLSARAKIERKAYVYLPEAVLGEVVEPLILRIVRG